MKAHNWIKGSLQLIVLRLLYQNGTLYGYELRRAVTEAAKGRLRLTEAALYTALHKMAAVGWLSVREKVVEGRQRKYYRLNAKGRKVADQMLQEFEESVTSLRKILRYKVK